MDHPVHMIKDFFKINHPPLTSWQVLSEREKIELKKNLAINTSLKKQPHNNDTSTFPTFFC